MARSDRVRVKLPKDHPGRRLAGEIMVAGASYAGNRLVASDRTAARLHKSHTMRKLIGLAIIAGAAYAAEMYLAGQKRKRQEKKFKNP